MQENKGKESDDFESPPQDYQDPRVIIALSASSGGRRKVLHQPGGEPSGRAGTTGTPTRAGPTSTGTAAMTTMMNRPEDQDIARDSSEEMMMRMTTEETLGTLRRTP